MNKHILLIEDDKDACFLFKQILEEQGFSVKDLHEGTSILDRHFIAPDLFVMDHILPIVDGVAITKFLKLRPQTSHVPVIMMSADCTIKVKALKAGASAFIEKPFLVEDFLSLVKDVMNRSIQSGDHASVDINHEKRE